MGPTRTEEPPGKPPGSGWWERRDPRGAELEDPEMARKTAQKNQDKHRAEQAEILAATIGGKLGLVAGAVLKPTGATLDDLIQLTGWQPHTIRAALTRLRPRGIDARPSIVDGRKAFRAVVAEG